MRRLSIVVAALLTSAFALPMLAQPSGPPPGIVKGEGKDKPAEKRGAGRARLAKVRDKLLKQRLGLDDAAAKKVEGLLAEHAKARREANQKTRQAQRELRRLLRADDEDQDAYRKALLELEKSRETMEQLRKKHLAELKATLTPKQQAQLLQAMHRVRAGLARKIRGGGAAAEDDDGGANRKPRRRPRRRR